MFNEWPLLIFTILAQMAVGAFLVLGAVHLYVSRKTNVEEADRMSDRALVAIIVVLGLGLIASIFHLGNPAGAPRAISNVANSWLSREIAFGAAFGLFGFAFALMQWFKWGTFQLRNIVAWIAGLFGIGLIYSMARAYMLPAMPAWNNIGTPISFFATALLLGALALGVAFFVNYRNVASKNPDCADCQQDLLRDVMGKLAILAIVMLGVEFVIIPLQLSYLASQGGAGLSTVGLMNGSFRSMLIWRLVLAFLGVGLFGAYMIQVGKENLKLSTLGTLAVAAFALVLVGEVLGRFLFYATAVRVGL